MRQTGCWRGKTGHPSLSARLLPEHVAPTRWFSWESSLIHCKLPPFFPVLPLWLLANSLLYLPVERSSQERGAVKVPIHWAGEWATWQKQAFSHFRP